jgi:glucose/arabinose dehydrogenase
MRVLFSTPASDVPYHNGGRIAFGPDGKLWAIVGDAHDPANAQDLDDDRGKIVRLEPDGDVPRTNPFGNPVFAYGIRNGFGLAFDPVTGDPWVTDNGPACNDEVDRIRRGRNYGWGPSATCDGSSPENTNGDGPDPVLPEWFVEDPIGITGIAFCDGCRLGARSRNAVFVAAVNDGKIRRLILDDDRRTIVRARVVYDHPAGTISLEVGPGGRIYVSTFQGIYRLARG